jgi:hypothetical protein
MRNQFLYQQMCLREPISSTALALSIFGGGVATAAQVAFASAIISIGTTAVIAGASYALQKTLTDKQAPGFSPGDVGVGGINAPEVRGSVRQSSPAQRIIYGRTRVGGAVFFLDTETPPYLYLGLLLSSRRISAINGLRLSTNDITFLSTEIAFNTVLTPFAAQGQVYIKNGNSRLWACFRDGDPDQTIDALLDADFPNLDGDFRQRGIATATFKFAYGDDRTDFEEMWGQVSLPAPQIDVDGAPVYDPRDPTQIEDDESTWRFSRNAALIQADWLRQPYGVNFPSDRIDWDRVADAASFDDELVGNADGTLSPRHTIDGVVTLNQKPREVMEAMLTANRGFVMQSRGRGWIASSRPRDPVLTIHDGLLLGGFEFRDDRAKRDTVNRVLTQFSSSDRQYQDIKGPVLERADLITEDEEELEATVRLPFTSDHRAAQRLSKQYLEESRLPRALTCRVKLDALGVEVGNCVRVYSEVYERMNGLYTIEELGFLDDFSGITLSLAEYDPSIAVDWNPETDEQEFELPELDVS